MDRVAFLHGALPVAIGSEMGPDFEALHGRRPPPADTDGMAVVEREPTDATPMGRKYETLPDAVPGRRIAGPSPSGRE